MEAPEPNGVVAVFDDHEAAHAALEWLEAQGTDMRSVSILGPGSHEEVPPELDESPRHLAEIGKFWGRWGAVVGAALGSGVIAIPVLAILVGAGPFATMLAAAVAAAAGTAGVGALTGALMGIGIHEHHARTYARALREGKFVVVVHADLDEIDEVRRMLETQGPQLVDIHAAERTSLPS